MLHCPLECEALYFVRRPEQEVADLSFVIGGLVFVLLEPNPSSLVMRFLVWMLLLCSVIAHLVFNWIWLLFFW